MRKQHFIRAAVAAVAACVALASSGIAQAADPGGISGFVRYADGSPVPYATLYFGSGPLGADKEVRADSRGFFVDMNVVPGFYVLTVTANGRNACATTEVHPDQHARVVVQLPKHLTQLRCMSVRQRLVDPNATADIYRIQR